MSKYFKERESIKLSEFLEKDISDREDYWTRAMIDSIDDFELPEDIIKKFVSFLYYGGKYDVSREIETVKGLYDFYKKFPKISDEVFYKIAKRYIKDLFEDYSLDEIFEKMIKTYGETDETIEIFIMYIDKKAEELDKKYEEKATKLDQYEEEYGGYITYLKQLVTKEHISVDKIIKSMPEPELIKRDEEQLGGLSRRLRCDITVYPSTIFS